MPGYDTEAIHTMYSYVQKSGSYIYPVATHTNTQVLLHSRIYHVRKKSRDIAILTQHAMHCFSPLESSEIVRAYAKSPSMQSVVKLTRRDPECLFAAAAAPVVVERPQ